MTTDEVLNLLDFDEWATGRQFEAIAALSEEQYEKDLGCSHGSLRGTLVHVYAAQLIWYTRWKGESPTALVTATEIPTLELLQTRWKDFRSRLHEFAVGLTEEKLRAPLAYKDMAGVPYEEPLSSQIRHVINHSTYHRGQITTMLRQISGAAPPPIDLIRYYRSMTAAARSSGHA